MTKEELLEKLEYEIIPDIVHCKDENSAHNRHGKYGLECEGQYLELNFAWKKRD